LPASHRALLSPPPISRPLPNCGVLCPTLALPLLWVLCHFTAVGCKWDRRTMMHQRVRATIWVYYPDCRRTGAGCCCCVCPTTFHMYSTNTHCTTQTHEDAHRHTQRHTRINTHIDTKRQTHTDMKSGALLFGDCSGIGRCCPRRKWAMFNPAAWQVVLFTCLDTCVGNTRHVVTCETERECGQWITSLQRDTGGIGGERKGCIATY